MATGRLTRWACLDGDARGRAGRRRDGGQHDQVQVARVRDGRRDRVARGCVVRGRPRFAHADEFRDPRLDHRVGGRRLGRSGQPAGSGGRSDGADRAARSASGVRGVPPPDLRWRDRRHHGPAAAGSDPERPAESRAQGGGGRAGRLGQGRDRRGRSRGRRRHGRGAGRRTRGPGVSDEAHLLELRGVAKHFGGLYALSGLDLHVDEGEIVSVIGPNGAGKSTMFNVVTGLYPPDDGDVRFLNETIIGLAPNRITRLGIARTFQTVHLFANMTVLENAMVGQHCRGKAGVVGSVIRLPGTRREEERIRERARESLEFFGSRLAGYRQDQAAFSLSYANRRRLEMARALATEPVVVLLDEPTAGMNPHETLELRDHIVRMRDVLGLTVLVIEHDMRVVKGVSDRVIALDYGRKIAEGTYEKVAHDPQVIEAYLGTKATG